MSTKNSSRFMPLVIAVCVVVGILIGTFYAKHYGGTKLGIINGSSNKLNALLRVIDDQYVDTVNMTDLVEKAMPQILAELDPTPPTSLHKAGRSQLRTGRQLQWHWCTVHHSGGYDSYQQCSAWWPVGESRFDGWRPHRHGQRQPFRR